MADFKSLGRGADWYRKDPCISSSPLGKDQARGTGGTSLDHHANA